MPMEAYNIQCESRRLLLSILCGAKKNNKVIPAAQIPRAQAYAEIEIPEHLHKQLLTSTLMYSDM